MRRNLNTQDGGNLRQKMLIKLFINHLGFVTNDYEQGYYSLNRNGFFIEIVFQVKIRSTSLCVKKKLHAIYFSLFSNKLLPRVNYFSLIWFVNILGFWLKSREHCSMWKVCRCCNVYSILTPSNLSWNEPNISEAEYLIQYHYKQEQQLCTVYIELNSASISSNYSLPLWQNK